MKRSPKLFASLFGVAFYFWAVLTAGRNSERVLNGEAWILLPFHHSGLVGLALVLSGIVYLLLRRLWADPLDGYGLINTYRPLPAFEPRPLLSALNRDDQSPPALRALPANLQLGLAVQRGFHFRARAGMPMSAEERERYDQLVAEAQRLLAPGAWVDLTPWSREGALSPYETLLAWYRDAMRGAPPPDSAPPPPSRKRHLRLIPPDA